MTTDDSDAADRNGADPRQQRGPHRPRLGGPECGMTPGRHDGGQQLAASPDGRVLAGAGHDGTVRLWQLDRAGLVSA